MKDNNLFKTYLIYFITILCFVGVRILSSLGIFSGIKNQTVLNFISTGIIQVLILFVIPLVLIILIFKQKPKQMLENYKYKKLSGKSFLYSLAIGVLASLLNFFVAFAFSTILAIFGYEGMRSLASNSYAYNTLPRLLEGLLLVAILPAFAEEFLHRGFVLNNLSKSIGYKKAILISSVLFGLMHLNVNQVFYAIILGVIIGFVAVASDNIWPAVIIHFINNFLNVYADFSYAHGLPFGSIQTYFMQIISNNFVLGLVVSALLICAVVYGLIFFISKLFQETRLKKIEENVAQIVYSMEQENTNQTPVGDQEIVACYNIYLKERFKNIDNVFDLMVPKTEKDNIKTSLKSNLFLISCLVLGILITAFTFIWGVL